MNVLIMAGGQGTRFWPESTSRCPKQYLKLIGGQSFLYNTLDRFSDLAPKEKRYIVTTNDQADLAVNSSGDLFQSTNLVLEPEGRNTAPCIFLSLVELLAKNTDEDELVFVVPSDHVILNKKGFEETVAKAAALSKEKQGIVTIGIPPHSPHTGFGYIEKGEAKGSGFEVESFKEKPKLETAVEYLKSGQYLWNAGMFMAPLKVFLEEFQQHAPSIFQHKDEVFNAVKSGDVTAAYKKLEEISVDYAIMEKSQNIFVCPAEFDWNDLGSWDALEQVLRPEQGNTLVPMNNHLLVQNAKGNIIKADQKLVALLNVDDLIIVSNKETLVVLPKKDSQKIKDLVGAVKSNKDLSEFL